VDIKKAEKLATEFIQREGDRIYENWKDMKVSKFGDGGADVSTNFDEEVEKEFYDFTRKHFPDSGFEGEEFPELITEGEYKWLIDPIDGSKFYAAGIPLWCSTIALLHKGEPVLGLVYNPVDKNSYKAGKGSGAFLNDKKVKVDYKKELDKAQIYADQNYQLGSLSEEISKMYFNKMTKLQKLAYRVRMLGSGTYGMTWVGTGFFGAYVDVYRPKSKMVDLHGAILFAEETGAKSRIEEVNDDHLAVLVAHQKVFSELEKVVFDE
jgi:myo-inositol-1(or 4)-monophosphatase